MSVESLVHAAKISNISSETSPVVSSKQLVTSENAPPPIPQTVPQQQQQQQQQEPTHNSQRTLNSPESEIGNSNTVVSSSSGSSHNTKSSPTYSSSLLGKHNSNNYLPSSTLHSTNVNQANRTPLSSTAAPTTTTFDYLYEFSETRKVLEDFFKCPTNDEEKKIADCFNESDTGSFVSLSKKNESRPQKWFNKNIVSFFCFCRTI